MRLTKTNSGNWAKRVTVGSRHEAVAFFRTRAEAEAALRPGLVVVPVELTEKLFRRLYPNGDTGSIPIESIPSPLRADLVKAAYMLARPARGRQVMQHATAGECAAHGVTPGPCNL